MRFNAKLTGVTLSSVLMVGTAFAAADEAATNGPSLTLEEVIVTANKRTQSAQDVAGSLTALSADAIANSGITRMSDYLASLPSVSFQDKGVANNKIVIRGVTSGLDPQEEPTTGVYVGDTPVSGIGQTGAFDVKLVDVQRIEVLRGPQGTLYGAGSMGGALKIIPALPDLAALELRGDATTSWTDHGAENYDVSAVVSVPLIVDKLAIRGVAYRYDQAGYVDNDYAGNPIFGAAPQFKEDVNDEETNGGRLIMLYQPTPELTASLTALAQKTGTDGMPESQPSLGEYIQARGGKEYMNDDFKLVNLNVNYDFGGPQLTSSTSFVRRKDDVGRSVEDFIGLPVVLQNANKTDFFVQEARVSSTNGALFWIAGAYYSQKKWEPTQRTDWFGSDAGLSVVDAAFGIPDGTVTRDNIYSLDAELKETQVAFFGDGTYSLTPDLNLAVGLRWFKYDQDRHEVVDGLFNGFAHTDQRTSTSEDELTPRVNLSYKPADTLLLYSQASKGFRVGRVNLSAPLTTCGAELASYGLSQVPERSNSDSLWSYEAGAKLASSDHRTQLDMSAFYIDWSKIQTNITLQCGFAFYGNAGKASNRGVEFQLSSRVADALTLSLSGSYNDAHLDEDAPLFTGSDGHKGDRIPGVPRYNAQLAAQYEHPIGTANLSLRADYTYVSDYYGTFTRNPNRRAGDYGLANLRLGVEFGRVSLELFADNLTNEDAILITDAESLSDQSKILVRPRTVGIRFRAWN